MKNLCIFQNHETKVSTQIFDYDDIPTFQKFFSEDDDEILKDLSNIDTKNRKVTNTKGKHISEINVYVGQKTQDAKATNPARTEDARANLSTTLLLACTEDARTNPSITYSD